MSNAILNTQTITSDLDIYTTNAKAALLASKDSAMLAAANCFMVVLGCKHAEGLDWLNAAVKAFNDRAELVNAPFEVRKTDAAAFTKGEVIAHHLAFDVATSPEHAAEIAVARAELEADAALPAAYWAREIQALIPTSNLGKQVSAVVKVVLDLGGKKQAALHSRFTRVVRWLDQQFAGQAPCYDDVIAMLKAVGGFEAALRQDVATVDAAVYSKTDRQLIAAANEKVVGDAMALVMPIGTVALQAQKAYDGNVILLGRVGTNGVDVIGEVPMSEADVKRALRLYDNADLMPANPTATFLDRVLRTGRLVDETVAYVVGKGGQRVKVIETERKVTLRPDVDGKAQMVISPRYDEVGMVLHATPMAAAIDLGPVDQILLLKRSYRDRIQSVVADPIHRRFLTVAATAAPTRANGDPATSKLAWTITNSALDAATSINAETCIYWGVPAETSQLPLDVLPLANNGRVRVSRKDLQVAFDGWVKGLRKAGEGEKFAVAMAFSSDQGITLSERDPENNYALPAAGRLAHGVHLKFTPKDVYAVTVALLSQRADVFEIQPDAAGGMAISWMDDLAKYRLFVPTCRAKDLSRSDRLLAQMTPCTPAAVCVAAPNAAAALAEIVDLGTVPAVADVMASHQTA